MGQAPGPLGWESAPSRAGGPKLACGRPPLRDSGLSSLLAGADFTTFLIKEGKLPYFTHQLMGWENTLASAFLKKTGREKMDTDQILSPEV